MNRELLTLQPSMLIDEIDWNFLFVEWDLHGRIPQIFDDSRFGKEAKQLYEDSRALVQIMRNDVKALFSVYRAMGVEDDIVLLDDDGGKIILPQLRNQTTHFKCISDYVEDNIVLFAITTKNQIKTSDDYVMLMSSILCDRLADAMLTYLEKHITGIYGKKTLSIAYGYPAAPDHSGKQIIYDTLQVPEYLKELTLTKNYSMSPTSSIMGFMVLNDSASYFSVGKIGKDQLEDYSRRVGISSERMSELIPNNL